MGTRWTETPPDDGAGAVAWLVLTLLTYGVVLVIGAVAWWLT